MDETAQKWLQKYFPWLLLSGILINATGLFSDILEPDGTLYACIAKQMAINNDWVNLFGYGRDWLDKPHFPFWVTAFSFKIFGITAFAYKIPAFIFWLIGIRFTFILAKELYGETAAKVSVLLYVIAAHSVIANFDVRAEPYLTTLTIGSIYYLYKTYATKKFSYLLAGALLAACAVMTKGIFILVTIGGGMAIYWIISGQWKEFLNIRWWLLIILILLFITPELYCLYMQFDMHPEKEAWGQTNVSGIRFFFWDSQFGRFLNTGPIKGSGDWSFFFHTTLWAFLPWSVLFYIAVIRLIARKTPVPNKARWIVFASAGITFILFSLSGFQLPHYIIILFPQFSMITADYLLSVKKYNSLKKIIMGQFVIVLLSSALLITLIFYSHLLYAVPVTVIMASGIIAGIIYFRKPALKNIIAVSYIFASMVYLFMNLIFYPQILPYQGGMAAARWLNAQHLQEPVTMYKCDDQHSFEFYADKKVSRVTSIEGLKKIQQQPASLIYTSMNFVDSMRMSGFHLDTLQTFDHYHISKLSLKFLNTATRAQQLEKVCVAKLYSE